MIGALPPLCSLLSSTLLKLPLPLLLLLLLNIQKFFNVRRVNRCPAPISRPFQSYLYYVRRLSSSSREK